MCDIVSLSKMKVNPFYHLILDVYDTSLIYRNKKSMTWTLSVLPVTTPLPDVPGKYSDTHNNLQQAGTFPETRIFLYKD
jgi:hypothetical protein